MLSNTSWVSDFLSGQPLGTGDEMAAANVVPNAETSKAAYALDMGDGANEVTVILPDGSIAKAVLKREEVLASAAAPPLIATD